MNKPNTLRLVIIANLVLVLALSLNSVLSFVSFENVYRDSLIKGYEIIGRNLKNKIETAVNFGKPIDKFYGAKFIMKHYMAMAPELTGMSITLPDSMVLYSTDTDSIQKKIGLPDIPDFTRKPDTDPEELSRTEVTLHGNLYFVTFPIYKDHEEWVGNLYVFFKKDLVNQKVLAMVKQSGIAFAVVTASALAVMVLLIFFFDFSASKRGHKKTSGLIKKQYLAIAAVLLMTQLAYTFLNSTHFKQSYLNIVNTNIHTLSRLVKVEIDRILKMGIPIERLKKVDVLLADILKNVPECSEIIILDTGKKEKYRAGEHLKDQIGNVAFETINKEDPSYAFVIALGKKNETKGYAVFIINRDLIDKQSMSLIIDALTVIVISLLFGFEILVFSAVFSIKRKKIISHHDDTKALEKVPAAAMPIGRSKFTILRSVAFIFFFAEYIPLAFLPLFIKELIEQNPIMLFGLSKQTMLSLPISSYMLGVSIFVLVAGNLLERISLVRCFVIFGLLQMTGSILSALSQDVVQLLVFRFISGLGYGGVLMAGISFIIHNTDQQDRTTGFGYWLTGNATATICGVPIGSLLAQYLGFRTGVMVSGLFSAGLIIFILYLARNPRVSSMFETPKDKAAPADGKQERETAEMNASSRFQFKDLLCVFKDLDLFASLFFASVPVQMALVGFLHYALPLYLDSEGISQSNIGRFTTLFGLAYIVCVPFVSKWSDKLKNERIFIICGNLIVGFVLIWFNFTDNIYMILVVIVVLGAGNAFVTSPTGSYITMTNEAKKIGPTKLSSIFKTYQKLFIVLGPLLIGTLTAMYGYMSAMMFVGFMISFCQIFFLAFSRRLR